MLRSLKSYLHHDAQKARVAYPEHRGVQVVPVEPMISTSIGVPWNKHKRTYSASRSKELGQNTVQQFDLSSCPDEFLINESTL